MRSVTIFIVNLEVGKSHGKQRNAQGLHVDFSQYVQLIKETARGSAENAPCCVNFHCKIVIVFYNIVDKY